MEMCAFVRWWIVEGASGCAGIQCLHTYFVTDASNLTRSTPVCLNTFVGPQLLQGSPKQTNAQLNIAVCLFILLRTSHACTTTELLYLCGRRLFTQANAPFPIPLRNPDFGSGRSSFSARLNSVNDAQLVARNQRQPGAQRT